MSAEIPAEVGSILTSLQNSLQVIQSEVDRAEKRLESWKCQEDETQRRIDALFKTIEMAESCG